MLHSLTSLRFFAALMVVLHHLPGEPFAEGYTGVTFFFILSGFILAHSYADRLAAGLPRYEFWIARFARVYPLHLLTMLLALPAAVVSADGWRFLGQLAAQITLTQAFVPSSAVLFSFNYPAWSLSVEALFYLLFPFLIAMPSRRLVLVIAAAVGLQLAALALGRLDKFIPYFFPPARLVDFATGILLYRFWTRAKEVPENFASGAQVSALVLLASAFLLAPTAPKPLRYDLFYVIPMGAIVLACAWQQGAVSRWLGHRWLVLLGDASFALYLVHQLMIRAGEHYGLRVPGVAYILVAVAVSILLHKYYELPAKAFTVRVLRRWAARVADARLPARA
jgi:peptidoglycan/LPS O-acetylase OafA/YrhL